MLEKIKQTIYRCLGIEQTRYLNFLYRYDMKNYLHYSCMSEENREAMATEIRILSHTIEKAMSLPDCRLGFGKAKITRLIELCEAYGSKAEIKDPQALKLANSVIHEYLKFNTRNGYEITFLPEKYMRNNTEDDIASGVMYVQAKDKTDFETIAKSRHSVRYYSDREIDINDIRRAVEIAQTAPSACNRQSVHVYACVDKDKIGQIMEMHGGVRGFGTPGVIFAIAGNLNLYQGEYERNTVFVDGGIFVMNMLYALEAVGMVSCPIIWGSEPTNDDKLIDILGISRSHKVVSLIMAGYPVQPEYRVAVSAKRELHDILHVV